MTLLLIRLLLVTLLTGALLGWRPAGLAWPHSLAGAAQWQDAP